MSPALVVLLCATAKVDTSTPSPGNCDNRCLKRRLQREHEQPVLQGLVDRKEGQGDPYKSHRTGGCLESISIV